MGQCELDGRAMIAVSQVRTSTVRELSEEMRINRHHTTPTHQLLDDFHSAVTRSI